jgi:aromatic ring-opening dioxygenase LigB subunit
MAKTHAAALEIERLLEHSRPDTIVIATPHGVMVDGFICVGTTEIASGSLRGAKSTIEANVETDQEFAQLLLEHADAAGVPVANYVASPEGESVLPLDWGVIIPLWYCGLKSKKKYKYVIVSPSNSVHFTGLIAFGRAIAKVASHTGKRVTFIASCDWAHAHSASGPYGFHPDAKRFDKEVQKIVAENRLGDFAKTDAKMVENALADGIPQALILHGAIDGAGFQAHLHSYQCPTYFGMLVASFTIPG